VLLTGVVTAANPTGQVVVEIDEAPGSTVFGRNSLAGGLEAGQAVNIAMRPEDVRLIPNDGRQDSSTGVPGKIETIQFVGERVEYRVNVEGQPPLLAYGDWRQTFPEASEVWVQIEPDIVTVWPAWAKSVNMEEQSSSGTDEQS